MSDYFGQAARELRQILDSADNIELEHLGNILDANNDVEGEHLDNAQKDPGATSTVAPGFGTTWLQASASRPADLEIQVTPQTDGTSDAVIDIEIDEDGTGTVDRTFTARTPGDLGAIKGVEEFFRVYIPAGGQYRVRNTSDPNVGNTIDDAAEIVK